MNIFKTRKVQIAIIMAVFLLFGSSAIGLLELNFISGLRVGINSQLADNPALLSYRIHTADFVILLVTGLVLSVLLPVLNPLKASLLTLGMLLAVSGMDYLSLADFSVIPSGYFILTLLMLFIVNSLISYFIEIHTRQKLIETLGQYIPPHIVETINRGHHNVTLDGEARELTVLFCDIQDFTRISEELNPKQVASLLNEYFTVLSKIIFHHHGTIDKFIGDSIMAFWGAPLSQPDHAQKAVLAALDMSKEIPRLSDKFKKRGWPGPKAGFGINTGLMAVGNMGSVYRMAYTVIGDAVNIAARVESLTRAYHVPVIVSETTMQASPDVLFREINTVMLKGKRSPTRVYQPLTRKDQADQGLLKRMELHQDAINCYYEQRWTEARKKFNQLRTEDPADKYYAVMLAAINRGIKPDVLPDEIIITNEEPGLESTAEIRK